MIVDCPTCRTRYRTGEAAAGLHSARCTRCDERFDLAPRARQYVLLPVAKLPQRGALVTPLPVGMDDPGLAGQLEASGRALDRSIPAAQTVAARPPRVDRRPGREWFGLLLLTALGAAAGFHGAVLAPADPVSSTAAGTVGGLILGWSWIRAAERKR